MWNRLESCRLLDNAHENIDSYVEKMVVQTFLFVCIIYVIWMIQQGGNDGHSDAVIKRECWTVGFLFII